MILRDSRIRISKYTFLPLNDYFYPKEFYADNNNPNYCWYKKQRLFW